jgi:hypothetical protein
MFVRYRLILSVMAAVAALTNISAQSLTPSPEGRVTVVFHDVQLWPAQADARPAVVDDKVDEGTALRTGNDSRSDLTFTDLTITRLGANTVFSFNKAGRSIRLDAGSILLYARKNCQSRDGLISRGSWRLIRSSKISRFRTSISFWPCKIAIRRSMGNRGPLQQGAKWSWHIRSKPDRATATRTADYIRIPGGGSKSNSDGSSSANAQTASDGNPDAATYRQST